jgi:SAM-dependent methyltransferase
MATDVQSRYEMSLKIYQDYPMPIRSKKDDESGAYRRPGDNETIINALCFGGQQIFGKNANRRVLIAGGGTGDSTVFFAKVFKEYEMTGDIVHLDQSESANVICRNRLKELDLDNVTFSKSSIFELNTKKDGYFDFVNCNGVLHHLADPDEGLHRLSSVTRDGGALGIWIYAKYGRAGLYHIQATMADLLGQRPIDSAAVELAKELLNELPSSSLGKFDSAGNVRTVSKRDVHGEQYVDRFLHTLDQPYSAREMFEFVERASLIFSGFQVTEEALLYEPLHFVKSPLIRKELERMSFKDRSEVAERIHCSLNMHRIFAVKGARQDILSRDTVMMWRAKAKPREFGPDGAAAIVLGPYKIPIRFSGATVQLMEALDGQTSNGEIIDRLGLDSQKLIADEDLVRSLMPINFLTIRAPMRCLELT